MRVTVWKKLGALVCGAVLLNAALPQCQAAEAGQLSLAGKLRYEIRLSDGSLADITALGLTGGTLKISGLLQNSADQQKRADIFAVLREKQSGAMKKLNCQPAECGAKSQQAFEISVEVPQEYTGYSVELMAWQPDGLRPLCEKQYFTPADYPEEEPMQDAFDALRLRWKNYLIGGRFAYDTQDADISKKLKNMDDTAAELLRTMQRGETRAYLWSGYAYSASAKNPSAITGTFGNLKNMAIAYRTPYSAYYGDQSMREAILDGLSWAHDNWYHQNVPLTNSSKMGNWWEWEIGTPLQFADLLALMYGELSPQRVQDYCAAIEHFCPDPRYRELEWMGGAYHGAQEEGANRVWKCMHAILQGIVAKDEKRVLLGRDSVNDVFVYVDQVLASGDYDKNNPPTDGFYTDGTFIQHGKVPYNGGYGVDFLNNISGIMYLLGGSQWDVPDESRKMLCDWVVDSFEPVIYKGAMMDMFRGRGIASATAFDRYIGHEAVRGVLKLADFAPEPYASRFRSMAKYWISSDMNIRNYYQDASDTANFTMTLAIKRLMEDDNIKPRGPLTLHKQFPEGDRVVHRTENYGFGISMSSDRIYRYSCINDENISGWYTGAGMTTLLTDDFRQFQPPYWATQNKNRLPGTTSERREHQAKEGANQPGASDFAGGASLQDQYGVAGMQWQEFGSTTAIKKSWFMFDNEIVALGADLHSSANVPIDTTLENRVITWQLPLKIDDTKQNLPTLGTGQTFLQGNAQNASWAWIGNGHYTGFYFPSKQNITWEREKRKGTFKSMNPNAWSGEYTQDYLSLYIQHGTNPNTNGEAYAYAILPQVSNVNTVADYAANPDFEVLENYSRIQAVHEKKLGIVAANFFSDSVETLEGYFSCNKKASVITREQDGVLEVAVSDPTHNNQGKVRLNFEKGVGGVQSADQRVTVLSLNPLQIEVDVNGARGRSISARFALKQ